MFEDDFFLFIIQRNGLYHDIFYMSTCPLPTCTPLPSDLLISSDFNWEKVKAVPINMSPANLSSVDFVCRSQVEKSCCWPTRDCTMVCHALNAIYDMHHSIKKATNFKYLNTPNGFCAIKLPVRAHQDPWLLLQMKVTLALVAALRAGWAAGFSCLCLPS